MKASYREMFDEVRASGRLNEEVMNMTKQERTQAVKKVSVSFVIAAALAVLLAGTALAAAIGVPETLQEWFNQQWTEAGGPEEMPKEQAAVIESLVQPVGVTCVNKGVSVTLDSVTAGKNNIWLILKVKGEMLTGKWKFGRVSFDGRMIQEALEKAKDGFISKQHSMKLLGTLEDGTEVYLFKYSGGPSGVNYMEGGELELRLSDIYLEASIDAVVPSNVELDEPVEVFPDLEARWILPFTLEPLEEQPSLIAKSASLNGTSYVMKDGKEEPEKVTKTISIQNIQVTSIGFSYTMPKDATEFRFDMPSLRLKGGMTVEGTESVRSKSDEKRQGSWDLPVDLSKVESIRFGDVVIPLETPKK